MNGLDPDRPVYERNPAAAPVFVGMDRWPYVAAVRVVHRLENLVWEMKFMPELVRASRVARQPPPAIYTEKTPAGFLLEAACRRFPEWALWMLESGAEPTPEQYNTCLLESFSWGRDAEGDGARVELAWELVRRGADICLSIWRPTELETCLCDAPLPLARALLETPALQLRASDPDWSWWFKEIVEWSGRTEIETRVLEIRAEQARWGELRRAWVLVVVRAGRRE